MASREKLYVMGHTTTIEEHEHDRDSPGLYTSVDGPPSNYHDRDVFGDEQGADIKYKTLSWRLCAVLMIAEIVSNGVLSLPQALAVVGIVPGTLLIIFLGIFALYTSLLLIDFKLRHPQVHNMGDAGLLLGGPVLRELLSAGTVIFAIFATGSQLLAGQAALGVLSDHKLCLMLYTGIFAIPMLFLSFPRTLEKLSWLCIPSCICILIAGLVGMGAAAANPAPDRHTQIAIPRSFYDAFLAILNPVFSYAGHFIFFGIISEMQHPHEAKKAAWTLQTFATTFYCLFAIVGYIYLGPNVASPAFSSLPIKWAKVTYGIALPNFLIAGSLYSHTAAKLFFVRLFRRSEHLHNHTLTGWGTWTVLIILVNGAAFVLAIGVPIFAYLVALAASLFASWYTYGIAGAFWLFDTWHDGGRWQAYKRRPGMVLLNSAIFVAGAFICVAGTWVSIRLIIDAYTNGTVGRAFAC